MKKLIPAITDDERAFIAARRLQIALDARDWSKADFIPDQALAEMSPWKAAQVRSLPSFGYCIVRQALFRGYEAPMENLRP